MQHNPLRNIIIVQYRQYKKGKNVQWRRGRAGGASLFLIRESSSCVSEILWG